LGACAPLFPTDERTNGNGVGGRAEQQNNIVTSRIQNRSRGRFRTTRTTARALQQARKWVLYSQPASYVLLTVHRLHTSQITTNISRGVILSCSIRRCCLALPSGLEGGAAASTATEGDRRLLLPSSPPSNNNSNRALLADDSRQRRRRRRVSSRRSFIWATKARYKSFAPWTKNRSCTSRRAGAGV